MLPEIALLEIFDFCVDERFVRVGAWYALVHVCRKWRNIIFGSPRRLNLRLFCGPITRVGEMLDIWPPLPIVVGVHSFDGWCSDNIGAALKLNDRICGLYLTAIPRSRSKKVLAAIQQPFPSLKHLHLAFQGRTGPVDDPDLFLGGSAPGLKSLFLKRISVPGLPKLLFSATHLVRLELYGIPDSGYISPEAMLAALSTLTKLESLAIVFESSQSRPDQKSGPLPPQTRILLPVLADYRFKGFTEYLEVLATWIDAPLLYKLAIIFFRQQILDTPQLAQFISRAPKFKAPDEAHLTFSYWDVSVTLPQTFGGELELGVTCEPSDPRLTSLVQIRSSSVPRAFISAVERLYIIDNRIWGLDVIDIENSQWLELFHPFTAVKELYLSPRFAPSIALALQELIGERVTEVLPALQTIFLEETLQSGPVQESIGQFVAARQLAGYIITVSRWEGETDD
jgi:hypothetical protein